MCQRSIYARSCTGAAEEVQLLAEENWIIQTLNQTKKQRNCLQIERLHLESLKAQLKQSAKTTNVKEKPANQDSQPTTYLPSRRNELMSAVDMMTLGTMRHNDEAADINDDMLCNNQALNLNLQFPDSFNHTQQFNQHEYSDDESSSDVSGGDNVKIDMNMLMNGEEARNF